MEVDLPNAGHQSALPAQPALSCFERPRAYGWQEENHSFSQSLDDLKRGANPYYSAGALLARPLANVFARNNYKAGKVAKHRAVLGYAKLGTGTSLRKWIMP